MAPPRPSDWHPLADADPVPGDPDGLSGYADGLTRRAQALASAGDTVKGADTGPLWTGLAASMYDEHRSELPPRLAEMGQRHSGAAAALKTYAGHLTDAQAGSLAALHDAQDAERRRVEAEAGVDEYLRHQQNENRLHRLAEAEGDHSYQRQPWTGPDWYARLDHAEGDLAAARKKLAAAVAGRDDAARTCAAALNGLLLDDQTGHRLGLGTGKAQDIEKLLNLNGAEIDPSTFTFVVTKDGLVLNDKAGWMVETYKEAGIDFTKWDPTKGLPANDEIARKAWEFYAHLFDSDPQHFLWAGMAKLAGGTFYAGFQDIYVMRRFFETAGRTAMSAADIERQFPGIPAEMAVLLSQGTGDAANWSAGQMKFVETTFLRMQKDIFDDLAWQHVAYQHGGIAAIDALPATDMPDKTKASWHDIDSGDPARIKQGNADLLYREQHDTIQQNYDRIRDHSWMTHGLTTAMSVVGESPVDGGKPFREVEMTRIIWHHPEVDAGPLHIPLPPVPTPHLDANVSVFDDRWHWIEHDMLPAYQHGLEQDPAGMRQAIDTPIEVYGRERRYVPNIGPFEYP